MAAKIASAVITLLLTLGAAIVVLVFMLVVMNGFSERDATWGIATYVMLVVIIGVIAMIISTVLAGRFLRREMHAALAALLAIVISSVIGAGLVGASGFAGVVAADIVRRNR